MNIIKVDTINDLPIFDNGFGSAFVYEVGELADRLIYHEGVGWVSLTDGKIKVHEFAMIVEEEWGELDTSNSP